MGFSVPYQEPLFVGRATVFHSESPTAAFAVAFEDDGDTGYFYALETVRVEQQVLDSMLIYNVASVTDCDKPSTLQIAWSEDGLKAVVSIDRYPHAVFDFENRRGYCRTNFPMPDASWTKHNHAWDDEAINLFR